MKTLIALATTLSIAACSEKPKDAPQQPANEKLATVAVNQGQELMKPVGVATQKALDQIKADFDKRETARREKIAADREARKPKAYRWKDDKGAWHLTDTKPEDGTAVETIEIR